MNELEAEGAKPNERTAADADVDAAHIAWISVTPSEPKDTAELAAIYAALGVAPDGAGLDHVLRVHALMPRTLREHLAFYQGILRRPGPLSRLECEVIGVAVSTRNGCLY